MLIPIQLNEGYIYYLNLTKVSGLTLVDRTKEEGYISGWYLYFSEYNYSSDNVYKVYKTKEEVEEEIKRINKISGKILKIWEQNEN